MFLGNRRCRSDGTSPGCDLSAGAAKILGCCADRTIVSGNVTCSVKAPTSGKLEFFFWRRYPLDARGSSSKFLGISRNGGGDCAGLPAGGNRSSTFGEAFLLLSVGGETGVFDTTGGFSMISVLRTDGIWYALEFD